VIECFLSHFVFDSYFCFPIQVPSQWPSQNAACENIFTPMLGVASIVIPMAKALAYVLSI
jgi:hypothetical protein